MILGKNHLVEITELKARGLKVKQIAEHLAEIGVVSKTGIPVTAAILSNFMVDNGLRSQKERDGSPVTARFSHKTAIIPAFNKTAHAKGLWAEVQVLVETADGMKPANLVAFIPQEDMTPWRGLSCEGNFSVPAPKLSIAFKGIEST